MSVTYPNLSSQSNFKDALEIKTTETLIVTKESARIRDANQLRTQSSAAISDPKLLPVSVTTIPGQPSTTGTPIPPGAILTSSHQETLMGQGAFGFNSPVVCNVLSYKCLDGSIWETRVPFNVSHQQYSLQATDHRMVAAHAAVDEKIIQDQNLKQKLKHVEAPPSGAPKEAGFVRNEHGRPMLEYEQERLRALLLDDIRKGEKKQSLRHIEPPRDKMLVAAATVRDRFGRPVPGETVGAQSAAVFKDIQTHKWKLRHVNPPTLNIPGLGPKNLDQSTMNSRRVLFECIKQGKFSLKHTNTRVHQWMPSRNDFESNDF